MRITNSCRSQFTSSTSSLSISCPLHPNPNPNPNLNPHFRFVVRHFFFQCIVARRGEVVFQGCVGKMNVAQDLDVQMETISRFYSMTKTVTSVAVLQVFLSCSILLSPYTTHHTPHRGNRGGVRDLRLEVGRNIGRQSGACET